VFYDALEVDGEAVVWAVDMVDFSTWSLLQSVQPLLDFYGLPTELSVIPETRPSPRQLRLSIEI